MTTDRALPHRLERSVLIRAPRETVFGFFTDSERWASWWGAGSTIDATPGGAVYIRHPGGVESTGAVVEVAAPERIVFTYGFASGQPIPPGSSLVTISLESVGIGGMGTRLNLVHEFSEAEVRDEHVQGWRYQLAVFANVVADDVHADAARVVDEWLAAWSETDETARQNRVAEVAASGILFQDRFSLIEGVADLVQHLAATHRFMPGLRMVRDGEIRHCQGTVLADWVVRAADGQERGRGTSVFVLEPPERVASVIGFWNPPPAA